LLTGKMKTTNPEELQAKLVHTSYRKQYLRTLDQYRPRQIVHRIRKYFKFMFVREPPGAPPVGLPEQVPDAVQQGVPAPLRPEDHIQIPT